MLLDKFLEKLSKFLRKKISKDFFYHHKFQNKNQITNIDLVINLLKRKGFNPKFIVDVGCGHGEWFLKTSNTFLESFYFLFDANRNNEKKLFELNKKHNNLNYNICLLSDDISTYNFYNMGYGSSIFEEQTNHDRYVEKIESKILINELPNEVFLRNDNLIKLDVQGAEKKILDGLKERISHFEVVIMEVSLHNYNKDSPLFDTMINYMKNKNYRIYDIYDLKRLGNSNSSYLLQFDCVFVRNNSNLLNVKF